MVSLGWLYKLVINRIWAPILAQRYNLQKPTKRLPQGPNLILSNHVTNSDFLLIENSFFCDVPHIVIAENALRNKILRWLLKITCEPIVHVKEASAVAIVKEIVKRLKTGKNVILFPEGNTTFDGKSQKLDESIGKLAKLSGCNVVLVKISGGYLTKPRWAAKPRRGRTWIDMEVIEAEQLKQMSAAEITEAINCGLYVDAYADQKDDPVAYKSNSPCVGIERALYQCPKCKAIGTLKGEKDVIGCSCGYKVHMDQYGFICEDDSAKTTLTQLITSQRNNLKDILKNASEEPIFEDIVTVKQMEFKGNSKSKNLGQYRLKLFADSIGYESLSDNRSMKRISFENVKAVTIFKANTLTVFLKNDTPDEKRIFEIKGEFSFNALKYRDVYEIITGK